MYGTELWSCYAGERMADLQHRAWADPFPGLRVRLPRLGRRPLARRERNPRPWGRTTRQ